MKTLLILVTVLAATATSLRQSYVRDDDWGYGETNGPDTWPDTYPTCGGSKQSPLDFVTDEALPASWEPLEFSGYDDVPLNTTVTNVGHTAQVKPAIDASVSGGELPDRYIFTQFHFHWGSVDDDGSEHSVDGERFSAELHMVHYMEPYGSVEEAELHDNGVGVFSVLLELSPDDNPALEPIVDSFAAITRPEETVSITPFALRSVLPSNTENYYRYEGSLTTPACEEVVLWSVFRDPIPISSNQLNKFRQLQFEDGSTMQDNFRGPQALNDREVYLTQ